MSAAEIVQRAEATRVLRTDADVLRYLGLDPTEPSTIALFRLATRYGLDPLLRQIEILPTVAGPKAYISREGYLALADRTGELRGIRTLEEHEGDTGWRATVEVRTVDGGIYIDSAGCGKTEPQGRRQVKDGGDSGLRMAIARAERRALKRAFSALPAQDGDDEPEPHAVDEYVQRTSRSGPPSPAGALPGPIRPVSHQAQREARLVFNVLPEEERDAFVARHGIEDLGVPWPDSALDDLFGPSA